MQSFGPIAPFYDLLMSNVPYGMWKEYFKLLLVHWDATPARLLDVCCGTGTVAEMLAEEGADVTGFDLSAAMIEEARRKAVARNLEIDYFVADATAFSIERKFECAYSFFDSLNYITTLEGFRAAIQQVYKHLEPNGLFIFDLNTAYAFEADLFTQRDKRKKRPVQYEWQGHYDPSTRVIHVEMDFWHEGHQFHETHTQRAHSPAEVVEALRDAGFERYEVYESYSFDPPRADSDRVHYVAKVGP